MQSEKIAIHSYLLECILPGKNIDKMLRLKYRLSWKCSEKWLIYHLFLM